MDQVWVPRHWQGATGALSEEQPGLWLPNAAISSGSSGPTAGRGWAPLQGMAEPSSLAG